MADFHKQAKAAGERKLHNKAKFFNREQFRKSNRIQDIVANKEGNGNFASAFCGPAAAAKSKKSYYSMSAPAECSLKARKVAEKARLAKQGVEEYENEEWNAQSWESSASWESGSYASSPSSSVCTKSNYASTKSGFWDAVPASAAAPIPDAGDLMSFPPLDAAAGVRWDCCSFSAAVSWYSRGLLCMCL